MTIIALAALLSSALFAVGILIGGNLLDDRIKSDEEQLKYIKNYRRQRENLKKEEGSYYEQPEEDTEK